MLILHDAISIFISPYPKLFARFCVGAVLTKLQISPLLPGLRMSTLAKNVSQVVLYENQVSDFVALLWMQTPLGSRTSYICVLIVNVQDIIMITAVLRHKKDVQMACTVT